MTRRRIIEAVAAVIAIVVIAALFVHGRGSGTPSGATGTVPPSPVGGRVFTNCGAATYIEPEPQPTNFLPDQTIAPVPTHGVAGSNEVLALAHQFLAKQITSSDAQISCVAQLVPAAELATFVSGIPSAAVSYWVVVATGKFAQGDATVHTAVIIASSNHPLALFRELTYPGAPPAPFDHITGQ